MTKRIIARLDVKGDDVVRGIHLEGLRKVGKPEALTERYYEAGIDEIVYIDTVATLYGRNKLTPLIERSAERTFIPVCVGGGVRSAADVHDILRAGADKVTLNSAAVRNPAFITELAREFGSQCVVSAIEAKRRPDGGWAVMIENARESTGLDAIEWAKEVHDRGAGEILLTSIDRDGTRRGCDLELTRRVADLVPIPVIASGGPARPEHIVEVLRQGHADAVALGTILHFELASIDEIKLACAEAGVPTRRRPRPSGG